MSKIKISAIIISILIFLTFLTGCLDFFSSFPTTYEKHPTKISYTIKYGYSVNAEGTGTYTIKYECDIPEVLSGMHSYQLLHSLEYETKTFGSNDFIFWNISGKTSRTMELGITANIEAESFIVSDLKGENALTVEQISQYYPTIANRYLNEQYQGDVVLIDPNNPNIKTTANQVILNQDTDNSFIIAKELFKWLKQNVNYEIHLSQSDVQPAFTTFKKKTGDCDDLSVLYISLCRAAGIPARFIRGFLINEENGDIIATGHAWSEVFVGGSIGNNGWIPVECACCTASIKADINQNFGVESAYHLRLFVGEGSNESLNASLSSISYSYGPQRTVEVESISEVTNFFELESKQLVVTDGIRKYE